MGAESGRRVVRVTRRWDGNETHRAWLRCIGWDVCFTGRSSGMNSNNQKMNEWTKSGVQSSVLLSAQVV
jgi:hypothetical protein